MERREKVIQLNEMQLINQAQKGDVTAYEQLIRAYEQKIYQLCISILKNPEEAYDAAQEVCLKVWRQIVSYKYEAKFSTWIYKITTNQCLDILRKNKRKIKEVSLNYHDEEGDEEKLTDIQSIWQDVSEVVVGKEKNVILMQAIAELKEEYRLVLVLRDIEDYSYDEIAHLLDLSVGTVKSRISRARKGLKKILEQDKEPYRSFFRQNK